MRDSRADPPSTGALLIHGLGGTEYDLGSMHKILKRAGIETHSLTLPGHGTTPEDLLPVRMEDWLDAVTRKYHEVAARHETLHVMGMCLGALLAVELCKRVGHRQGKLVSLAAPVYIDGWSTPWYRGLRQLVYRIPGLAARMRVEEEEPYGIKNELVRSIVKAKFERGDNFHYRWVPLACVREVDRLRRAVKQGLDGITCPTLIVHAHEDELTSVRSARFLHAGIADSQMELLDNSYHMICVDNDRDRVAANILQFMDRDPASAQSPRAAARGAPMGAADIERILGAYRTSLLAGEFETLFPLFAEDVVWREEGDNPICGVYEGRGALIELFSRLMDFSRNTFAVNAVGQPALAGRSIALPLRFQVQDGPSLYQGTSTHTLRLRNNAITQVTATSDEPQREDALWRRLAAASGHEPEGDAIDAATLAINADALPDAFEAATIELRSLPQPPSAALAIRLTAYERQARHGDAPPAPAAGAEPGEQVRHAAWRLLAGLPADQAQRRYIALVRRLDTGA
ncbi:acyl-CoA-binding protein [Achromobacter seleniivolatilans]|uniref:Acyl-CoA-binding protein n=1 Tax=Achromobacter seleniivolatilans TaxID=3047478 RepID=A0ABY9M089_9BURK|nr:acyl-CoA-binding protein [Achromobacter sp. R39]WMD20431.1 acyl-CoA-binding protein [Achromobacter sp. R39]